MKNIAKTVKLKISATKRAYHLKSKKKAIKVQKIKSRQKSDDLKGNTRQKHHIFGEIKGKIKVKCDKPKRLIHNQNSTNDVINNGMVNIKNSSDKNEHCNDITKRIDAKKKSRKRKYQEESKETNVLEKLYTKNNVHPKQLIEIGLLPIKSKGGEIISRSARIEYKPLVETYDNNHVKKSGKKLEYENDDEDFIDNHQKHLELNNKNVAITMTDLLLLRRDEIKRQKFRIGVICSSILEKPEDKIKNLSALFHLMDEVNENNCENYLIIRKIACTSICEVFKDILPEYRVGQVDPKMTTVRKTTLERITYETLLLQQFKKYLQRLEKITICVTKKQSKKTKNDNDNDNFKTNGNNLKMCLVAVECLSDLLLSHSYFNYVQNIGQLLVYVLNCNYQNLRDIANKCFCNIFMKDNTLDMTLYIIRRINHLIKTESNNVHSETITCLMSLKKLKNIDLNAEKENELKQKKLENHRQRLLSLSKKEKKRRKRLVELNRELHDTQAEENKQLKYNKVTEIIKMMFTIYFRILKNQPNSKLLSNCLEGLAEYAHIINVEIFNSLITVLNDLLEKYELGYREQLHCIQTIFTILSGQGQIFNIDPRRFYGHLYRHLFSINAGRNHNDFQIIINILTNILIKNRKNINQQRFFSFLKRLLITSLYLLHNGTMSCLGMTKNIMQMTSMLEIILDVDANNGSGKYDAELNDPEYCNANTAALYELSILQRHYHAVVKKMAVHIASSVPASGAGSLPANISKLSAIQLFEKFDSTKMVFNPPILIPNKNEPKIKKTRLILLNPQLMHCCKNTIKRKKKLITEKNQNNLDFYQDFISRKD